MELNQNIQEFLNYIGNFDIKEKQKFGDINEKINKLEDKSKREIFKFICREIFRISEKLEEQEQKQKCVLEGHYFTDWEYNVYNLSKDLLCFKEVETWKRKCTKCGFTETVNKRPKGLTQHKAQPKL